MKMSNLVRQFATGSAPAVELREYKKRTQLAEVWRRFRRSKGAIIGLIIIGLMVFCALFANLLFDYDTEVIEPSYDEALETPSFSHWFGTDELGRDVFARVVFGARLSLYIGLTSTFSALLIGVLIGAFSGYIGGRFDAVVMRVVDVFLALPSILLALTIVAALGPNINNLILAISVANIPYFARIFRAEVLAIKDKEYIEASRALGAGKTTIIFREILPNCLSPIIVQASIIMALAVIVSAEFSFLGLGVQPPTPEWGCMVAGARKFLLSSPYLTIFPGLAIMLTVLAFNLVGDALRDATDPRLKH
jgi:peptide/nickel transport system permease protein